MGGYQEHTTVYRMKRMPFKVSDGVAGFRKIIKTCKSNVMEGYSMLNRSIGQKITEIRLIHEEIYTMSEPYFRSFPKSIGRRHERHPI